MLFPFFLDLFKASSLGPQAILGYSVFFNLFSNLSVNASVFIRHVESQYFLVFKHKHEHCKHL
jgi:hypothetical protein